MHMRRGLAELLGTMLLVATVVGSGIMGERLAGGNVAVALLANTAATAAALVALITTLAPVSGAHFNPVVTVVEALAGALPWRAVPTYLSAQLIGGVAGTLVAHVMFELPLVSLSTHVRAGPAQIASEVVATAGLLLVIAGVSRARERRGRLRGVVDRRGLLVHGVDVVRQPGGHHRARVVGHLRWYPPGGRARVPGGPSARCRCRGARDPRAVAATGANLMTVHTVIFACVHNAGRSQMAAALFNVGANPERAQAISAGTAPGERVHPEVVTAMRELGVDLSAARPQRLTDELARGATLLVTMGCGEACPVVPSVERDDWPLPDPKGQSIERVRAIRDDINGRVLQLLAARGWRRVS